LVGGLKDFLMNQNQKKDPATTPLSIGDEGNVFAPYWPAGLKQDESYRILCDDKGRNGTSWLKVYLAPDGDAHCVMMDWEDAPGGQPTPFPSIRIRTFMGGGRNHRTHQALLWLAQAIRLDNEENKR
jgi:hypothetical protein